MRFSLQQKLLVLLVMVTLLALSSSLLLRNLIIRDFKAFGEGRMLDRLYQVQAVLEGRYEHAGTWRTRQVADDLVWAWLSGIEIRLYDGTDQLVLTTDQALSELSPVLRQRISAVTARLPHADSSIDYQTYPLFLRGEQVGRLDVRLPRPIHENFFIRSSDRFLAYSVIGLGVTAILLSFLAARRISRPLQQLTTAAAELAKGEVNCRVEVSTSDEIGSLASTFNQMADTLAAQERLRKELVSNAAHELRTPLMIIKGELEGMMDGLLPTTPDALQSLHDEATRLATILDGVDELTRAQAAHTGLHFQTTDLLPFFKQIANRFSQQAEEQQIALVIEGNDQLTARIDPDQFSRVMINLFSNALRAMPHGGQLTVSVTRTPLNTLQIAIKDTGTGIEPEQLPHIFERFYKGKQGGLGLGLAIVKELVDAHGGTISASSEPDQGTCFLISLPLYDGGAE